MIPEEGATNAGNVIGGLGGQSLFSESAIYLASNGLNALIPFALLPVLTRHLSQAEYGEVAIFQTYQVALSALTGLSLNGAAARKYYDLKDQPGALRHYIGACVQLLLTTSTMALCLAFVLRDSLAAWLGIRAVWIPWAVLASASGGIVLIRMSQWQVRRQTMTYGALQITQSFLNMSISLLLVVGLHWGADGRMFAMVAVPIALAFASLLMLSRDGLLAMAWRPAYLKEAARFGLPLAPHVIGLLLLTSADRIVVNSELGTAQAGVYMVAVQVAMGLALLFDSFNSAYVPWLFERLKRDVPAEKRATVRFTYWYFAFALAAGASFFLFGPAAVTLIAGASYAEAGRAIGWLALGQGFAGMYLMVTNYIYYSKRTAMLSATTIVSALGCVAILPPMTRTYGIAGAGAAVAAATAVRFVFTWLVAQRRHPMPWRTAWVEP